jgi:DNA-binding response OmpR family regulator
MAYNVFISFDIKDRALARDLTKRLEKAGMTVTIAEDPKDSIEELKKADEVIFLITNNAMEGKKILYDMGIATSLEKRLVPILVDMKPNQLPDIVKGLDFIKYDDLERYIGRLQRAAAEASKLPAKSQPKSGVSSKSVA